MTEIHGYLTERRLCRPFGVVNTFVPVNGGQVTETTGQRLKRYIVERWTRKQGGIVGLAKAMNVDTDTIYGWFRDERPPNLDHVAELARLLGVSRWEIVAAMDGEETVVDLQGDRARQLLAEIVDQALDARGVPQRRPRSSDGAA
jgi:transcriptional regulator with XRE-family HTH domain